MKLTKRVLRGIPALIPVAMLFTAAYLLTSDSESVAFSALHDAIPIMGGAVVFIWIAAVLTRRLPKED